MKTEGLDCFCLLSILEWYSSRDYLAATSLTIGRSCGFCETESSIVPWRKSTQGMKANIKEMDGMVRHYGQKERCKILTDFNSYRQFQSTLTERQTPSHYNYINYCEASCPTVSIGQINVSPQTAVTSTISWECQTSKSRPAQTKKFTCFVHISEPVSCRK